MLSATVLGGGGCESRGKTIEVGKNWRRGWDSNPPGSRGIYNLQIPKCQDCRECRACRRALHAIARWLGAVSVARLTALDDFPRRSNAIRPVDRHRSKSLATSCIREEERWGLLGHRHESARSYRGRTLKRRRVEPPPPVLSSSFGLFT